MSFRVAPSVIFLMVLASPAYIEAQQYKVLHNFGGFGDGNIPYAGVTIGADGSLFGTTAYGGAGVCSYCGMVFQLTSNADGSWTESTVHDFTGTDGARPIAGITIDAEGSLYGAAEEGGSNGGTVFKLVPSFPGTWVFSILSTFKTGGGSPTGNVLLDGPTRLYGTAGLVYSLNQVASVGQWYERVLHQETQPFGTLIMGGDGNLYGTTYSGGTRGAGSVFELTFDPMLNRWTETVLYSFTGGVDGLRPLGGVTFDVVGNLYGTTVSGGKAGLGVVYKLSHQPDGTWSETVVHSFTGVPDGANPECAVTFDSKGNLYGTADEGGPAGWGTVFRMTPTSGGQWTETTLYGFTGGLDGGLPYAGVTLDVEGNIYGTTQWGGIYGQYGGVVYEVVQPTL